MSGSGISKGGRPRRAVLLVVATALLLTGCAGVRGELPFAEPLPEVDCSSEAAWGRVPPGFDPVAAYRCEVGAGYENEQGRWSATAVERLEGELGPLLAAFAEGDEPRWPGPCAAYQKIVPAIWLVDAGGAAIRPAYPVDGCGQPKDDRIRTALEGLTAVDGAYVDAELLEPRAAMETGCPARALILRLAALDEVGIPRGESAAPHQGQEIAVSPLPAPEQVHGMRLCDYRADPVDVGAGSAALPTGGTFLDGRDLGRAQALVVLTAASDDATPATACRRAATRFVQLIPLDATARPFGMPITVENDGCQRLTVLDGVILASDRVLDVIGR